MARRQTAGRPVNLWPGWYAVLTYVAMVAALWCVFVYAPTEKAQGIVQRIFYFHVSSAMTMFVAFFVVFIASIIFLWKHGEWWDQAALGAAELGVLFCTLVLITGPIWGRPIWGVWWTWDPTLTLTLVLWLIYVAYLMLRADATDPRRARFAAILGIIGFIDVPLIRWSIERWAQSPSRAGGRAVGRYDGTAACHDVDLSGILGGLPAPVSLSSAPTHGDCAQAIRT